jgi:hypothetical protein
MGLPVLRHSLPQGPVAARWPQCRPIATLVWSRMPLVYWGTAMSRVLYVVACGLTLAACSGSPNWGNIFGGASPPPPPEAAALRIESDPPGAEATSSLGPVCRTPCAMPIAGAGGNFAVTMTVQVLAPDAPDVGGGRFTPNPVFAKLEASKPAKKKAARKKVADKPKPAADPETTASAPPPAAATPWPPPR